MRYTISSLGRRAAALALAALMLIPPVFASAAGEAKLTTKRTVAQGLTYINTISQHPSTGRTESYALELDPDSQVQAIMLQSSGTIYASSTVNGAIKQAQQQGWRVLGAMNTDYFSTATGVPMGLSIEDGVYKSSPEGFGTIAVVDGSMEYISDPEITMTLTHDNTGDETVIPHFNKWRTVGGLYLLNRDFSTVSTRTDGSAGWMVRLKLTGRDQGKAMGLNSTLHFEVTELLQTDQSTAIGEDEYILTAQNGNQWDSLYETFQVGDTVTLSVDCKNDALSAAQWAGGCGDLMVWDGEMTDTSTWQHSKEGRAPRTALGMKKDGTLVCYVADGRQSGYSGGLTQKETAQELLDQGCVWAVNLDGGGSSTMSVLVPGQSAPSTVNRPSDGKARSCATFLLFVTKDQGDGKNRRLVLKEDGLVVLAGSSVTLGQAAVLDSAANPLDTQPTDLAFRSETGLGSFDGAVYTAGSKPGTDTVILSSRSLGLQGTAQIHVVDSLSDLSVTAAGSTKALSGLTVNAGGPAALSATGTYWSRAALRSGSGVTWSVNGDAGTITADGVFTASSTGGSGSIVASAGGITRTIPVTLKNIHTDVDKNHWAYTAVEYCYEQGIVGGVSPILFGRDEPIRRGDFVLMLYAALGKPAVSTPCTFQDVSASDYYCTALAWGQANGVASGTGNGCFSPNAQITREQAFTILRQALPLLNIQCEDGNPDILKNYSDYSSFSDYALIPTATLVSQGIVGGKGSGIDPAGKLTRAEMAILLYNLLHFTPPESPIVPGEPQQPELPSDLSISLNETDITLRSGETFQLEAAVLPQETQAQLTWTVSDPSALTVNSKGAVTNIFAGVGNPTATVTVSCGAVSASCLVRCQAAQLTGTVTGAELGLNVRSGSSTSSSIIGSLKEGTRVVVLEADIDGWHQILFVRNGQAAIGYVSANYLVLNQ